MVSGEASVIADEVHENVVNMIGFDRYKEFSQGRKPTEGYMVVRPRRHVNFAETRKDNIMRYETAMNTVPLLAAAVWLRADIMTAYGYTFKFDTDDPLKPFQMERLKFLRYWSRFVELNHTIKQISACMDVYGDAFVEKVYDSKSQAEGGWGIKRLKIVHPNTVSVNRDEYGRVIEYIQEPYKQMDSTGIFAPQTTGPKTSKTSKKSHEPDRQRVAAPHTIVHFKSRDFTGGAYGSSMFRPLKETVNIMLGLEDDIADISRVTARPLTVWLMGDADNPLSVRQMRAIGAQIMSALAQGSDIAIDGRVDVQTVETGKSVTNLEPFQNYIIRQIIAGLGVPDTLMSMSGSSTADAEIKLEMFRRKILSRQLYIANKLTNEVFRDIFLFHPNDFKKKTNASKVININCGQFQTLPVTRWNEIEDISNRRLRVQSELLGGAMDMLEAKEDFGRNQIINREALHPQLQMYLAQAELYRKQASIADDQIAIQKEQLEVQKTQAKAQLSRSVSPSKPTSR